MGYCHIHGKHSNYDGGCPDCRAAEDQAADDRSETLEKLDELTETHRDLADAINNPGNYFCPHCKFRTLLDEASCCPKCRKDIQPEYWNSVRKREEENRKRAAEDAVRWQLNAPARMEAEKRRKEAEQKALGSDEGRSDANIALWFSLGGILCCGPLCFVGLFFWSQGAL